MRKTLLLAMLGVLCLMGRETEAGLISVGDFKAGTSSFKIPVFFTGDEAIASVSLAFSIGDGGPVLGGTETVTITAVDFITDTIWPAGGISFNFQPGDTAQSATVASVSLTTDGLNVLAQLRQLST